MNGFLLLMLKTLHLAYWFTRWLQSF